MNSENYSNIKIKKDKFNLTIVLNRPEKRNALNPQLVKELKNIFAKAAEHAQIKTITLKGAGKAFCSGADLAYLKELRNFDKEANIADSLSLAELYLTIYRYPKPVIAVVTGPALAGGCGLASVCDFIFATTEAKFGYPEVKIGFIAAMVSVFLIRQIGERQGRALLLSGDIISAEQALKVGMINEVFPSEKIETAVKEFVNRLHTNSSEAMRVSKQLCSDYAYLDIGNEIKKLADLNAGFRETDDFIEGITAFIEKRKPMWNK